MKPHPVDIKRHGSLGGEEVTMTFDQNSIAHIMGVLTDLYSDEELAIIREYSTNAYDSHIEAGQTRPIEVTTPTVLNPVLKIQDFGVGMSREDVINIYSKYGASTKRGTNEQTGTLGLGCKSALTHSDQFTVTAIKNGIKTIVNVSRGDDGVGRMELVDSSATNLPNGVTVEIPVSHPASVAEKAHQFFSYWKPGTVLLDKAEPSVITGLEITDNMIMIDGGEDVVVMGNVAYRVAAEHAIAPGYYTYRKNKSVVAWVPIGAVAFTPNREDLRYTKITKGVLSDLRKKFFDNLAAALQKDIDACQTKADAYTRYVNLLEYEGQISGFKVPTSWRGETFPARFDIKGISFDRHASRYQTRGFHNIGGAHDDPNKMFFITGFPGINLTSFYKDKIRTLMSDLGVSNRSAHLVHDTTLPEWISNATTATWEDVKAVKLGTGSGSRGGATGKQPILIMNTHGWWEEMEEDGLDNSRPIYFCSPADDPYPLRWYDSSDQIVQLRRNRWEKFKREHPTAMHFSRGRHKKLQDFLDNVPDDVLLSLRLRNRDMLRKLDETEIDDPKLVNQIQMAKVKAGDWKKKFNIFNSFSDKLNEWGSNWQQEYPLVFDFYSVKVHSHTYIYINAVYNSKEN